MINSKQKYISNYLTHFAGRDIENKDEQYKLFKKILLDGKILPKRKINEKRSSNLTITFPSEKISENCGLNDLNNYFIADVVCLSDIPLTELGIHMKKYSHFGISFSKDFMIKKGATPVYYISAETLPYPASKNNLKNIFAKNYNSYVDKINNRDRQVPHDKFDDFLLLHIFSYLKFWDYKKDENDKENYYFEREWRLFRGFDFKINDVKRIILPKNFMKNFKKDFKSYSNEIIFPDSYL